MLLDSFPRVPLAHMPTALEPLPRLGDALGLPRLWVKRDDCTGLAMGGNKARKLEYLFAEARQLSADIVLTTGGAQSNHARMTAAAARRLGMEAVLFLNDHPPAEEQGNLLLDRMFGAEVHFVPDVTLAEMYARMGARAEELRAAGRRPYTIPVGGSTPVGALGYVRAVRELAEQCAARGVEPSAIVITVGSTGTLTGVLLGAQTWLPGVRVYGISVSPSRAVAQHRCGRIALETAALLGVSWVAAEAEIPVYDDWLGAGYGVPTEEGLAAIRDAALLEGLLLDPVYTGKAMAATRGLAQRGELKPEDTVVFWHTGGAPAVFAFSSLWVQG